MTPTNPQGLLNGSQAVTGSQGVQTVLYQEKAEMINTIFQKCITITKSKYTLTFPYYSATVTTSPLRQTLSILISQT